MRKGAGQRCRIMIFDPVFRSEVCPVSRPLLCELRIQRIPANSWFECGLDRWSLR